MAKKIDLQTDILPKIKEDNKANCIDTRDFIPVNDAEWEYEGLRINLCSNDGDELLIRTQDEHFKEEWYWA